MIIDINGYFTAGRGSPGPQGEQGPQGPPGATGATGPAGSPGPAGSAGPTGATGAVGPQGANGDPGVQGPPGPQGSPGVAGYYVVQSVVEPPIPLPPLNTEFSVSYTAVAGSLTASCTLGDAAVSAVLNRQAEITTNDPSRPPQQFVYDGSSANVPVFGGSLPTGYTNTVDLDYRISMVSGGGFLHGYRGSWILLVTCADLAA